MTDPETNQPVPSANITPSQWLSTYFHTRAHLASLESDFHCDPACTRPGCTSKFLLVPVSLVDLLGAARHHHEPVFALYQRHYTLGLLPHEPNDWIRKVSLRLTKPCPFLQADLCRIYPVRPLACILFPEYLVCEDKFEAEAKKELFKDFLCLHSPLRLSPQRAEVVRKLKNMWEREILVTNYYLFNHSQCYIDFSNLTQELAQAAGTPQAAESTETPKPLPAIPHRVMEHFFQARLAGCPTFDGLPEKINRLNNPEGQMQFLQLLQDDLLVKKLMQRLDDRDRIFRFVRGKLKPTRRSLLPDEVKFY